MTSIKLGLLFEGDILPSVNKYILFLHLLAAGRQNSSNVKLSYKAKCLLCYCESYLSKSFIPLWFYQSLQIFWEDPGIFQIGFTYGILQLSIFCEKILRLTQSLTYSLHVFHIQSVNFLRQKWLQRCKWPYSHVLIADKIQAVKWKETAWIWLLLPVVAGFFLKSVLVNYFEVYKYHRADIHSVSPLLVIPVVKTLKNFCTCSWVTAGPPKCLSVLCHRSGLVSARTTRHPPQLHQLLMPNACVPGAPWPLLLN